MSFSRAHDPLCPVCIAADREMERIRMTDDAGKKDRVQTSARRATKSARKATKAAKQELSLDDIKSFSPALVGFVRGLLLAALTGAVNYIIAQLAGLSGGDSGAVGIVSTGLVAALRTVEGLLDVKLGAPRQARLLGAKPIMK